MIIWVLKGGYDMGNIKIFTTEISNVSSTLLVTLYSRAIESRSKNPIINDPKAEEIVEGINLELKKLPTKLARDLSNERVRKDVRVHLALRAKQYDMYTMEFLANHPDGVIVNLGCGFDTRFHRIDNGKVICYDLDLPEVIEIKKKLVPEEERYRYLEYSVLDYRWMDEIKQINKPVMFIAEGLLMYLPQRDVENMVKKLSNDFKGAILLCEVVNKKYTVGFGKKIVEFKMNKQLKFGDKVSFNFGLTDSYEMEKWGDTIRLIDDWVYFDADEEKIGWLKIFKNLKIFRETQWTVRYRL